MPRAATASAEATRGSWLMLFKLLKKAHRAHLFTGVALACGTGALSPTMSIFLGKVFNSFQEFSQTGGDKTALRHQVGITCGYIALLGGVGFFLNFAFYACWTSFGERQAAHACHSLFSNLLSNEISWFETHPVGAEAIAPHYQMQIIELRDGISQPLGYIFEYIFTGIVALTVSLSYSWRLTLVILSTVPVLGVVISIISRKMQPHIRNHHAQLALAAKHIANTLRLVSTVKCLNSQSQEIDTYDRLIAEAARRYVKQAKANALQAGITRCLTLLMFVQGFYYGWKIVNQTDISVGNVITAFWSSLTFTQAIEQIIPHLLAVQKACAAASALSKVSDPKYQPRKNSVHRSNVQYDDCIRFENVEFAYPTQPHSPVLQNLNCSFPPGETRFIIGKSGSGKSTIAQLLLRFYLPSAGKVLLGSRDISAADIKCLRSQFTLVEQQTTLFRGSLFDNIAVGNMQERRELIQEVEDAAEFALLRDTVINLEKGYDTVLSGNKPILSVGQQQRLAIARAKLRDPDVLILDECTNALDRNNRELLRSAIRVWRKNKTTIVITHDISQIGQNDFLYLLENGTVVAEGTRKSLEIDCNQHFCDFKIDMRRMCSRKVHIGASTTRMAPPSAVASSTLAFHNPDEECIYLEAALASPLNHVSISPISWIPTRQSTYSCSKAHRQTESSGIPLISMAKEPQIVPQSPRHLQGSELAIALTGESAIERRRQVKHKLRLKASSAQQNFNSDNASTQRSDLAFHGDDTIPITRVMGMVWPFLSTSARIMLITGLTCAIIHGLATPLFSWIFSKLLMTLMEPDASSDRALEYAIIIIVIAVGDGLFTYAMHTSLEYSGQYWVNRHRVQAFSRVLRQDMAFHENACNMATSIVHCLDHHAEETRGVLGTTLAFVLVALLMMIVCICWSLIVCWKLTLVAISMSLVFWLITLSYQNVTARMEKKGNDAFEATTLTMHETFTSLKTVRAYTLEEHFNSLLSSALRRTLRIGYKRAVLCGMFYGLSESFIIFVTALIFFQGAKLASSAEFSVPDILFVFSMLLFSMSHAAATLAFVPQISSSKDSAARLMHLSTLPTASEEDDGDTRLTFVRQIDFTNVSFSYPSHGTQRVLRGVNLHFSSGSITAIVGSSGSGKSTVAKLLLRLYPVSKTDQSSEILLDQHRIETLNTSKLRSMISIVPQEPAIFPNTVNENIAYGIPQNSHMRSKQLIRRIAQDLDLDDFIMGLSETYDTMIGDGYMNCSGGQSQRMMIARALLRRPSVLVLDEVTSALDAHNSGLIRGSIRNLKKRYPDIIVIIITHDREMMELADRIAVLEDGCVVEEGSYSQLLAEGKRFTSLIKRDQND